MKQFVKFLLLASISIIISVPASAQKEKKNIFEGSTFSAPEDVGRATGFFAGMSFDVSWRNNNKATLYGMDFDASESYSILLTPQCGWIFSDRLIAGSQFSFKMSRTIVQEVDPQTPQRTLGWDLAPYVRYKLLSFGQKKNWGIWADAHVYFGMDYPRNESAFFNNKLVYGVQVMPSLSLDIMKNCTFFVNFAIASFGYAGMTYNLVDGTKYSENNLILFTAKVTGFANSLFTDGLYGVKMGLVKKF